jgi:hypothetical protein
MKKLTLKQRRRIYLKLAKVFETAKEKTPTLITLLNGEDFHLVYNSLGSYFVCNILEAELIRVLKLRSVSRKRLMKNFPEFFLHTPEITYKDGSWWLIDIFQVGGENAEGGNVWDEKAMVLYLCAAMCD